MTNKDNQLLKIFKELNELNHQTSDKMKKTNMLLIGALFSFLMICHFSIRADIVTGNVLYHNNPTKPIPSVNLSLWQNGNLIAQTTTANNGTYVFNNIPAGTYTLTATTNITAGGITTGDGLVMFMHLCNMYPYTPIQSLASDLDGDDAITWNDYNLLMVGWFLQGYPFPVGDWTFQDVTFVVDGTKKQVPTMGGSSSGDVNGTFVPTTRTEEILFVNHTEKLTTSNFSAEIYANNIENPAAMGLAVDIPAGVDVVDVNCKFDAANVYIANNQVRVSWVNQSLANFYTDPATPVVTINARLNDTYNGSDLKFDIDPVSHFADYKGDKIETSYTSPIYRSNGNYLSNSFPNPCKESTTFYFTLPEMAKVNLNVYNQHGQLVRQVINEEMSSGEHKVVLSTQELKPGVYYYNLIANGQMGINQTKKLIVNQ